MKRKRLPVTVICSILAVAFMLSLISSSYSQSTLYYCKVLRCGPGEHRKWYEIFEFASPGAVFIELECEPDNFVKLCRGKLGRDKEMLAIAMSAITNCLKVRAVFDKSIGSPEISDLSLTDEHVTNCWAEGRK